MSAPALTRFRQFSARLVELLPCHCALCDGLTSKPSCLACDAQFFPFTTTRCPRCGIAVPLGPERLSERDFNQSLEIARPLAKALDLPLKTHCVLRQRETPPQSLLRPDERRKNMRHALVVSRDQRDTIWGLRMILVDDVMMAGETLNELASPLKRFAAKRGTNLVLAPALPQ